MKKFLFLLCAASFSLLACQKQEDSLKEGIENTIEKIEEEGHHLSEEAHDDFEHTHEHSDESTHEHNSN